MSSNDSFVITTSTPVACLKALTIFTNAASSASTKRRQRSRLILAPFSGFQGAACAQALAHSSRAGPESAAAAANAVPPCRTLRRVKSVIFSSPWVFVTQVSRIQSLASRLVEQVDELRIWFEPDLVARIELMPLA